MVSLTPGYYPTVLLNKVNFTSEPLNFRDLSYPNIRNFNYSFGDNFFVLPSDNNVKFLF